MTTKPTKANLELLAEEVRAALAEYLSQQPFEFNELLSRIQVAYRDNIGPPPSPFIERLVTVVYAEAELARCTKRAAAARVADQAGLDRTTREALFEALGIVDRERSCGWDD